MIIKCAGCGVELERRSSRHKYCAPCAISRQKNAIRHWAEVNVDKIYDAGRRYNENHREVLRQRALARYETHAEELKEKARVRANQAYAENPQKINGRNKIYRAAHPEKHREHNRQWSAKNKGKIAAISHRRRCAVGLFTATELRAKFEEMGNKCAHCGATDGLTVDHITPLKKGGTNYIDNIQPLCKSCNSRKGARFSG